MSENTNERLDRYAEAVVANLGLTKGETEPMHIEVAHAVMAVADAEQAELRAEVRTLDHRAEMNRVNWVLWRDRAHAAEAERDRARSLAATLEAQLAQQWEPSRWWRVISVASGEVWCETSSAEEARAALAEAPEPMRLQRLMRARAADRWEDA